MHAQVITYRLSGISQEEYQKLCEPLAPIIAAQPGLLEKTWLADPAANSYGGLYKWRDRASMEAFMQTDVVKGFASHPAIVELTSQDFQVWEAASLVTRGVVAVPA